MRYEAVIKMPGEVMLKGRCRPSQLAQPSLLTFRSWILNNFRTSLHVNGVHVTRIDVGCLQDVHGYETQMS